MTFAHALYVLVSVVLQNKEVDFHWTQMLNQLQNIYECVVCLLVAKTKLLKIIWLKFNRKGLINLISRCLTPLNTESWVRKDEKHLHIRNVGSCHKPHIALKMKHTRMRVQDIKGRNMIKIWESATWDFKQCHLEF
jgi:hypothetical protein